MVSTRVACNPHSLLSIDVGTNNEKLLKDPFYTGIRRKRVRGPAYDLLLDYFMIACTKRFGRNVLIQFEDFGNLNAYRLLDKYKQQYNMFNDDIQGTAAVVVAGLLTTTRVTKKKFNEYIIVFFGAGGAATGIAEMCVREMVEEGLTVEEACANIYMMDIDGLITKNRISTLVPRHLPFAKDMEDTKDLIEVIEAVKPHAIVGASTKGGAFTEAVIKTMAKINERPIIFALSNPTSNAECTAEAAIRHTNGKVLFASGSPFENVEYKGRIFKPGQGNNAFIFPGIGLGAVLFKSKHVTDKIFLLAARDVANSDIRELSIKIAVTMGKYLYEHNLATLYPEPHDIELYIRQHIYTTDYQETVNRIYDWPAADARHGYPIPTLERKSMEDE
ncbi:Malic enzyme [Trichostrongylus colubriformis]|uniref:Malic enzyme n=1 Tax=Trichostrongylus colubriformis TaxID=6319 RepID=A0AAN8G4G3_TRICO